jgi:hypothetical protein
MNSLMGNRRVFERLPLHGLEALRNLETLRKPDFLITFLPVAFAYGGVLLTIYERVVCDVRY